VLHVWLIVCLMRPGAPETEAPTRQYEELRHELATRIALVNLISYNEYKRHEDFLEEEARRNSPKTPDKRECLFGSASRCPRR